MAPESVDPRFVNVDPLRDTYRESIVTTPDRFRRDSMERAALLCIDMQYLDAARGYGVFEDAEKAGVPIAAQDYYFDQLDRVVLPNVREMQDFFRSQNLEVIHIRIQSLTKNGRDRSSGHQRLGLHAAPGSKEAEFLEIVAPRGDEIVINKTTSGAFTSTTLAYVLRNLDIRALYVTGVYTDECISTTVRDACDHGYFVTLVSDGCATVTEDRHEFSLRSLQDRYVRVVDAATAMAEIKAHLPAGTAQAS